MKIEIDIQDAVTPALQQVAAQIAPGGPMIKALGRSLANTLKAHFRARNAASPNKLGGKRTNFWSAVAATVQNPVIESDGVSVAVSHPHILQKYKGGKIVPGPGKKFLTIPVAREAYGRTAPTFGDKLVFMRVGTRGNAILAMPGKGKKGADRLTTYYLLVKSVAQKADPRTLPEESLILANLEKAARIALGGQGPV